MRPLVSLLLLAVITGCSGPTRTFDVAVRNELNQPITVWLTKSGPPVEANWLSPEQLATYANPPEGKVPGVPVPPGKTAETGKISGHFPAGTEAVLRVYLGQRSLDELLATGARNPDRLDIPLQPGRSDLIIKNTTGRLSAEPSPNKL
ncbi:MAG TPA: hypothetical protein VF669_18775 [Tepidisphaeraceae bacterium]|jgi:hypothetical protein